jgi:predicted transcriptional regulator
MEDEDLILTQLAEKSDMEIREILDKLYQEEKELSYRRRVLHGKIDILRAELAARLKVKHKKGEQIISASDLDKLSQILAGKKRD